MSVSLPPLLNSDIRHDPNAGLQGKWTVEVELPAGFELVGPATVIAVAADGTDDPLTLGLLEPPLVISDIAIGLADEATNTWGWSFDTEAGSEQMYWLLCTAQRTDGTSTYGVHRTVRLPSGNN